ncbi:MAG: lipoate--protein ligase [Firmicutes bacterium]|nr:lipoate--protein ligase [Bacillota bacterium]
MKLLIYTADGYDAHCNQALEAALTEILAPDTFILYLWSNDNAVFIGKNQNAYLECNIDLLKSDGGVLTRRITGGGAVYHDKGNLNYSFIASKVLYDEKRQFEIVLKAVNSLGFNAQLTGRNDITIDGRKFSGNAFFRGEYGLHHGTILIKSDYEKIAKYLTASKLKLISKNVQSVAARVINLSEICPLITKEAVSSALIHVAEEVLNAKAEYNTLDDFLGAPGRRALLARQHLFFTDETHILGTDIYYDAAFERRFDWGLADVRLKLSKSIITAAKIYSDCLDTELVERMERKLVGRGAEEAVAFMEGIRYG